MFKNIFKYFLFSFTYVFCFKLEIPEAIKEKFKKLQNMSRGKKVLLSAGAVATYLYLTRHKPSLNLNDATVDNFRSKIEDYNKKFPNKKKVLMIVPGTGEMPLGHLLGHALYRPFNSPFIQSTRPFFNVSKVHDKKVKIGEEVYDDIHYVDHFGILPQSVKEEFGKRLAVYKENMRDKYPEGFEIDFLTYSYGATLPLEMIRAHANNESLQKTITPVGKLYMWGVPVGKNILETVKAAAITKFFNSGIYDIRIDGDKVQYADIIEGGLRASKGEFRIMHILKEFM